MKTVIALLIIIMATPALSERSLAAPSPYESVQESTDILLARLLELQPIYESDPDKFFADVESALSPYIDFEGFARGVMAKYYRSATDEQKQRFTESFKHGLIRRYATALVEFDNEKVVVVPPDESDVEEDVASITLEVHTGTGGVHAVDYKLRLIDGSWLLRNVIIEGVNIGLQFRSQFNGLMQRHRNDIDKVIENWSVDVQDNA